MEFCSGLPPLWSFPREHGDCRQGRRAIPKYDEDRFRLRPRWWFEGKWIVREMIRPKVAKSIWAEIQTTSVQNLSGAELVVRGAQGNVDFVSLSPTTFLAKTMKSSGPTGNFEERKAGVGQRIESLQKPINRKLGEARLEGTIVLGSSVLTAVFTLGANAWSDSLGTATTLLAGSAGTGGIVVSTRDKLLSYFSMKRKYMNQLDDLKSKWGVCAKDEVLDGIEKEVNALYKSLYQETVV
jgi:hypothetical protein